MPSSGMLRCVVLVKTEVSKEGSASIIRVTRIDELEIMLGVTSNGRTLRRNNISPCDPDDGGSTFLRNVGSYKSHAT
jgi:hypothetical protein